MAEVPELFELLPELEPLAADAAEVALATFWLMECTSDPMFTICSNWLNCASSDTICVGSC